MRIGSGTPNRFPESSAEAEEKARLATSRRREKMATEHTAKAFDSDLQELTRLVAEMGGLAERMIVASVDGLVRRDVALGQRVGAPASRWPWICARSSAPCALPRIWSGSATSPRTWASASRRWRAIFIR